MDVTPFLEPRIAPRAVFERLVDHAERARFMVPSGSGWTPVTWGEFARLIRQAALFLKASGLEPGDRAAVFAQNSVEWGAAALAIQAAGGVMVPVYPASTPEQAAYVVEHSAARFVFASTATLARIAPAAAAYANVERIVLLDERPSDGTTLPSSILPKLVTWAAALAKGEAREHDAPYLFQQTMDAVSLDQSAVMLYTSGTTGNPKGVPLTHRNVAANGADWMVCNAPIVEEGAIDLLWLPMSHIFGLGELCIGNTLAWTTYLADPATVLAKLPLVRPTVFMSVPSHWEKIAIGAMAVPAADRAAKLAEITGGRLRFCLSGGAGLKREVKELFHACGVLIIEGYGLTECSPTLTLNRPEAFRFDTVGRPLPQVELKLAEDGEILAKGPNIFKGYHNDPAATAEAFTPDGWFKTGDVGRFTEDGFLQIVDRKKDILVTAGGKNAAPANIELRFRDDPFIAHVLVYGDAKRYLVAGVWLNEDAVRADLASRGVPADERPEAARALAQASVDRVNREVASYESIKRFAIMTSPLTVESGFLTSSLKVRRKIIYAAMKDRFEALYEADGGKPAHAPA
jgi:long-chain acyl-CoA synthetase